MSTLFCASPSSAAVKSTIAHDIGEYHHPSAGSVTGGVTVASAFGDGRSLAPNPVAGPRSFYHDEPEVDYDEGATELYKRIEGKDWDGALNRLEQAPKEARTWVSRKEPGSNKVRWRLLPLHATCIFRSPLAVIEALLLVYSDGPQMKDDQGMLPIHLACRNGASKGVVLTLLNGFPESLHVKDHKGRLPMDLVESSTSQNKEAVLMAMRRFQQEFAKGGDLQRTGSATTQRAANEVDYEHRTVLFRLILKKDWSGASARANSFPDEASTWIVTKGFNGNLRFLPIHKACVLNPPASVIEALVAAYAEGVKSTDQDGWLPLHCATFYGASEEVVSTLLVANPKAAQVKEQEENLPLHFACMKSAPQGVVESLLQSFPKACMSRDSDGRLPLHHAVSKGAPEGVVDALIKASPKGAQSKDQSGRLPLHHAARKNASEHTIRSLLRVYPRAAQIKDDQDKLPIHYAASSGSDPKIIHLLLTTYPESINVKNGFGYTPLAEAKAIDNPSMEPIIRELETFKKSQDKLKVECDDNAELEIKLSVMTQRVLALEQALHTVANLGKDLKHNMKKTDDAHALLSKFADKLASIDAGICTAPAGVGGGVPASPVDSAVRKRSLPSPLRGFGRKSPLPKK